MDELSSLRPDTHSKRHVEALSRLNSVARELLAKDSVDEVLHNVIDEAKTLTDAAHSALLLVKDENEEEVAKFVHNAPLGFFPTQLPRVPGLLAAPIQERAPLRLDDLRGHSEGLGIPVQSPIGPLLAVPIESDGVVFGELVVSKDPETPPFTELDEAVLTELGQHAVQAIRLAQAREASIAADTSRQAMLDLLRHDMMTPIATAKGAVDLLINKFNSLSSSQREQLLSALSRAVEGIERLAKNLRSDARLEAPRLDQEFSDIDVSKLLNELEQDLDNVAAEKGVRLDFRSEPDSPGSFRGGFLLIRQAIENFLTNAIKFSPRGGTVSLNCRRGGDSVVFEVSDEGPGIPVEDQGLLFLRFERRRRKNDPPQTGLGLGLSIVRRVAEAHGGAVGVTSQPGQGSTFWISFPLSSDAVRVS